MAAQKKTIDVREFYSDNLEQYLANLQSVKSGAGKPFIVKANTNEKSALQSVEDIVSGKIKDNKKYNKKLLKQIVKSGAKPTVKKVYQNVLLTFFTTNEAEYDYSYTLNGDTINISPKRISINEGYAEFTCATQCCSGNRDELYPFSYPWEQVDDEMLTETPEAGYVFANVRKSDLEKDSKESMKQYNEKLKSWLKDYQQEQLGTARRLYNVTLYDKNYDYNESVLLAPYILVSYDIGNMIITFSVCAITGNVEVMLLNDPMERFDYDFLAPPSFSIPLFLIISVCVLILGSIFYILSFISKKVTYNSKILHGYTLDELRKLL